MDFTSDEIIVREIKNRSDSASRYLIDNYLRSIVSVLMRRSNLAYYEAVDIANDAIVDGFMKIDQYNPKKGSLHSWLTRIAINSAINKIKRRKSVETVPLKFDPQVLDSESIQVQNQTENVKLQIGFHTAIQVLPEKDRRMVDLLLRGYSDKEIAETLGITYDTARQRKRRLLKKIKEILLSSPLFKKIYLKENDKEGR